MDQARFKYARSTRNFHERQGWGASFFQKRRLLKELLLLVSVVIASSVFYVWTRIQVLETGYRIGELKKQTVLAKETQSQLSLESATLRNPERLEKIAVEQFHFARPKPEQVIFLSSLKGK